MTESVFTPRSSRFAEYGQPAGHWRNAEPTCFLHWRDGLSSVCVIAWPSRILRLPPRQNCKRSMPKLGPVSLRIFIIRMRKLGWSGPYQEGKHPYMLKGASTLTVPNPHESEISQDLLVRLLRQAGVTRAEWMSKPR